MTPSFIRVWRDREIRQAFRIWLVLTILSAIASGFVLAVWKHPNAFDWRAGVAGAVGTVFGMILWGAYRSGQKKLSFIKRYRQTLMGEHSREHFVFACIISALVFGLSGTLYWIVTHFFPATKGFMQIIFESPGGIFAILTGAATIIGTYIAIQSILELKHTITSFPQLVDRLTNLIAEVKTQNKESQTLNSCVRYLAYTPLTGCLMVKSEKTRDLKKLLEHRYSNVSMVCLDEGSHAQWLSEFDGRVSILGKLDKEKIQPAESACKEVITKLRDNAVKKTYDDNIPLGQQPVLLPREKILGYHFFVSEERAIVVSPLFLPLRGATQQQQEELQSVQTLGFETTDRQIIDWLQKQHDLVRYVNSPEIAAAS